MSDSQPSLKRQRTDSNANPSPHTQAKTRDAEFWYADGTIVLTAGDVEFRIFKGLLVDRSPVFRDMFSFPQPTPSIPDAPTTCPEVALSDSPEDVRELLRVLMPGSNSSLVSEENATFEGISACIRLGHKYQVDHIVDQALSILRREYPNDFNKYVAYRESDSCFCGSEQAIAVINLARLTGATDLLPLAIAECCELSGSELVHGWKRPDGTRDVLSSVDLVLCLDAKQRLIHEHIRRFVRWSKPTVAQRCTGKACHKILTEHLRIDKVDEKEFATPDCLSPWELDVEPGKKGSACAACLTFLKERELADRQDVWNRLPKLVGVEVDNWVTV